MYDVSDLFDALGYLNTVFFPKQQGFHPLNIPLHKHDLFPICLLTKIIYTNCYLKGILRNVCIYEYIDIDKVCLTRARQKHISVCYSITQKTLNLQYGYHIYIIHISDAFPLKGNF